MLIRNSMKRTCSTKLESSNSRIAPVYCQHACSEAPRQTRNWQCRHVIYKVHRHLVQKMISYFNNSEGPNPDNSPRR